MSDQVIFTKEELEKIRESLVIRKHTYCEDPWYSCPKAENGCSNPNSGDQCNCGADEHNASVGQIIYIIDSPRPKPKVPNAMLDKIISKAWSNHCYNSYEETDAVAIVNQFGFDVED
jgi:hypothetical protein